LRRYNAVTFVALLVATVAGYRWYAMNPLRGLWLGDRDVAGWLLPAASSALLVAFDAAKPTAARAVLRMLLSIATAVLALAALAVGFGEFVHGRAAPGPVRDAAFIAAVPVAAVLLFISSLRNQPALLARASGISPMRAPRGAAWIIGVGALLMTASAIGTSYMRSQSLAIGDTEIVRTRDPLGAQWTFTGQGISTLKRENYASLTVTVLPDRSGSRLPLLSTEARSYLAGVDEHDIAPPAVVAGKYSGPLLETRLSIVNPEATPPRVRIEFIPLAPWLAAGAWLVGIGVLLRLIPGSAERGARAETAA
jgi:hypothetical protein